jgi:hypothetical protein
VRWDLEVLGEKDLDFYREDLLREKASPVEIGGWKGGIRTGPLRSTGGPERFEFETLDLVKEDQRLQLRITYRKGNLDALNSGRDAAECFALTMKIVPTSTLFPGPPQDLSYFLSHFENDLYKHRQSKLESSLLPNTSQN